MKKKAAFYARVSSETQAKEKTINSQINELIERIKSDEYVLTDEFHFIDNGHSGATLLRPSLERLRDAVALNGIERVYVHSPDRLARKYAYQVLLIDEFRKNGTEVVFLNHVAEDTPEGNLLLQVQGMISEYERAKILERSRRGKRHAALTGKVSVLGCPPYGYSYFRKQVDGSGGFITICEEETKIVQQIFSWIGHDRISSGEVCRRLNNNKVSTRKGGPFWSRRTVLGILRNTAYKGMAAFGKTKQCAKRIPLRPQKGAENGGTNYSIQKQSIDKWIFIPVPKLIEEELFEIVQNQLDENRSKVRTRKRGQTYLLQGLVLCAHCRHAYYGKPTTTRAGKKLTYYRCIGTDAYRYGGQRICDNLQLRTDLLETIVWDEVKKLLQNPQRLKAEYERRLSTTEKVNEREITILNKQSEKTNKNISRLIDAYSGGLIEKNEFEPRVKVMRSEIDVIEKKKSALIDSQKLQFELNLITCRIENFSLTMNANLESIDWLKQRDIIRALVKRIEIGKDDVNVVFRVDGLPESPINENSVLSSVSDAEPNLALTNHNATSSTSTCLQHCARGNKPSISKYVSALRIRRMDEKEPSWKPIRKICR
ncbi:MAG: recombinase family protein [Nitrosotalea sp.]